MKPIPRNEAKQAKAANKTERQVRLRIICIKPPNPEKYGAVFGLQDNSTSKEWVIHAGKVQPTGDVHFECECRVRSHQKTGDPNFLGDFVLGNPAQRFLYLSWRPKDWKPSQSNPLTSVWVRRMKIHLNTIAWDQIDRAEKSGGVLETAVEGTGRGGGPNCAAVPLMGGGWKVTGQ